MQLETLSGATVDWRRVSSEQAPLRRESLSQDPKTRNRPAMHRFRRKSDPGRGNRRSQEQIWEVSCGPKEYKEATGEAQQGGGVGSSNDEVEVGGALKSNNLGFDSHVLIP